ncbi:MAG: DUF2207 domain-containing protein [Nocardioides sp.]
MRRRLGLLAALLLMTAGLAACGDDGGAGPEADDSPSESAAPLRGPDVVGDDGDREATSITSYDAGFDVDADGRLEAVEEVTVLFPEAGSHGIYRYWETVDPGSIEVTADGAPAVVEISEQDDRYQVARIGDPRATVPVGEHVYEIAYGVTDVLTQDGTVFDWHLVPSGWRQPIADATLRVTLPDDVTSVQCGIGNGDDLTPCDVEGEGSDELTVHVTDLPARTGVTIRAVLG